MQDVMIDLETLGVSAGCAIVSIGAVLFNEHELGSRFYTVIYSASCMRYGLRADVSTLDWWSAQAPTAKAVLEMASNPAMSLSLDRGLTSFAQWFKDTGATRLWALGAAFDLGVLAAAYRVADIEQPWPFHCERCFRTLRTQSDVPPPEFGGVPHIAVDDASHQAKHLQAILADGNLRLA